MILPEVIRTEGTMNTTPGLERNAVAMRLLATSGPSNRLGHNASASVMNSFGSDNHDQNPKAAIDELWTTLNVLNHGEVANSNK